MKKKWFGVVSVLMVLTVLFTGLPAMAQTETEEDMGIDPACPTLGIRAPQVAPVDEEVTITVFDRITQEPVEGAFVFALSPGAAEALKAEIAVFRADETVTATEIDYESLVSIYGELLDITDENGEVRHAFDTASRYLLVAVKPHYLPGFTHITIKPVVKALGIRAPRTAPVGEEVTITVFERGTGEPVEGAFVFALSRDNAEALKAEIATLREDSATSAADIDYKALADIYGELIDITDENGEVHHAFDEAGWYLLLAVKPEYRPAFRPIYIGTVPTALVVEAPRTAPVGEVVTIGVSDRNTGEPVEGAGVWVLSRDNALELNEEMAVLREEAVSVADIDYSALVGIYGEFIDFTDENGEVQYAFDEAGWYLLVAVKPGCFPGFAPIRIGTPPRILGINAPRIAPVGQEVTIGVFERKTQSPVEGAGVWLVSWEKIGILKAEIAQLKEGVRTAENDVDFEPLVSLVGEFIDFTDENGEVQHTFEEPGLYFLVAVKRGYYPGFAPIQIRSLSADSSGNVPQPSGLRPVKVQETDSPQLVQAQKADASGNIQVLRWTNVIRGQVQLNNKPDIAKTD